jgi:PRTRC genetic system protein A
LALDPRDAAAQTVTPLVPVPRYGALPPLEVGCVRYLVAGNGIFVEARSRAMTVRALLCRPEGKLPYGSLEPCVRKVGGGIPRALQDRFIAHARTQLPNEAGGLILWRSNAYELVLPEPEEASPGRIRYSMHDIDPLDIVIDMHTHGFGSAFFSVRDDVDDKACPAPCFKAIVFGHLNRAQPSMAERFVLNGWAADDRLVAEQL